MSEPVTTDPTRAEALGALLERVLKATDRLPDDVLGELICSTGDGGTAVGVTAGRVTITVGGEIVWRGDRDRAPDVSLDAGVALVERVRPGWWWAVGHYGPRGLASANVSEHGDKPLGDTGARTPALALLAALLKSLAQEPGQ